MTSLDWVVKASLRRLHGGNLSYVKGIPHSGLGNKDKVEARGIASRALY